MTASDPWSAKSLLFGLFRVIPWRIVAPPTRPVTPEVAGSSPVAPVFALAFLPRLEVRQGSSADAAIAGELCFSTVTDVRCALFVVVVSMYSVATMPADGGASSGVKGVLRLSHGCPGPARVGDTRRCDFAGTNVAVDAFAVGANSPIGRDRTDERGRFTITLQPGRYILRAEVPKTKEQERSVSVRAAQWTAVTLRYLVPPYML